MRSLRVPGILVVAALALSGIGFASAPATDVESLFLGQSDDAGSPIGHLIFYMSHEGPGRPKLVVRLGKEAPGILIGEVFDVPEGEEHVPVTISGREVALSPLLYPAMTIRAYGDSWTRQGVPNYDLDIHVSGPMFAMWGLFISDRIDDLPERAPLADIRVREGQDRFPRWDLRRLTALNHFQGEGVYRTNYAERMCASHLRYGQSVSDVWPYISPDSVNLSELRAGPSFEQPAGFVEPPIKVDWKAGRVVTVSEVVPVRNHPCTYAVYSLESLSLGVKNDLNFEAPFAFYDLSGTGSLYPNLIVRTERYPAGDPWSTGIDPTVQDGRPTASDLVNVRYSWSLEPGDQTWDYKIDVVGPRSYEFDTALADGDATITAPSYGDMPDWVVNQSWPVISFISAEGRSYTSSEGIYSWFGAAELGAYVTGLADEPRDEAFSLNSVGASRLVPGLRGEYTVGEWVEPRLYLSHVDNRLHLEKAVDGLWPIDDSYVLQLGATAGYERINRWTLLRGQDAMGELVDLDDLLLFEDASGITVRVNSQPRVGFSIDPPTDSRSWTRFRDELSLHQSQGRDPMNLKDWLDAFPGPTWHIPTGTLEAVASDNESVAFTFALTDTVSVQEDWPWVQHSSLTAGLYTAEFTDGAWSIRPATPARLAAAVSPRILEGLGGRRVFLSLQNRGEVGLREPVEVRVGTEVIWEADEVGPGEVIQAPLRWQWTEPGNYEIGIRVGDELRTIGIVEVRETDMSVGQATRLSMPGGSRTLVGLVVPSLLLLFGGAGLVRLLNRRASLE